MLFTGRKKKVLVFIRVFDFAEFKESNTSFRGIRVIKSNVIPVETPCIICARNHGIFEGEGKETTIGWHTEKLAIAFGGIFDVSASITSLKNLEFLSCCALTIKQAIGSV